MADEKLAQRGEYTMASPSGVSWNGLVHYTHMSEVAAETHKRVAELTHSIPAKETTKRAWLQTARHCGSIGASLLALWWLLPSLKNPYVVGGLVALCVLIFGVLRAIKMFKGD
jgi:hypothetical protein